jgi:hypothetical protein
VPRFCRHNRFIERCPICRETVPGLAPPEGSGGRSRGDRRSVGGGGSEDGGRASTGGARRGGSTRVRRSTGLHVSRERRAEDDGYSSPLVRGLHASGDASRLAEEIAFAQGRLLTLTTAPPGLYGEMRGLEDAEQAIWMCFLSAYLCPLEGGQGSDPFLGIRRALEADWRAGELPNLDSIPLGPRSSHDPARGDATLRAYLQWAARGERSRIDRPEPGRSEIGQQELAFLGDPTWSATRRFERIFERLTLPGLARMGRYELLLTLGRIGLCELRAEALYFTNAPGVAHGDLATLAAKRVFGIGEPLHLEQRARELAEAVSVPIEALDLALANWGAGERATLGVPPEALDPEGLERARRALDL